MTEKNASGFNYPVNESQGGTNANNFNDARTNMGLNPLVQEKTLTYLVLPADRGTLIHYTGAGAVDLTLTAATTLGDGFNFILRNDATGDITINPDGGELINGAATLAVESGQAVTVFCNGLAFYTEGQAAQIDGANVHLSNLSAVAINTPLLSNADNTLEFGAQNNRWSVMYAVNYQTGHTIGDTYTISAWDVDGAVSVPFITFTAGNTPTCALAGSVTGVTQSNGDNSTKLATTQYVDTRVPDPLTLAKGGTSANLTASNGGIFYSTGSAGAILSGTATALQMLQSGANAAPTWSTATWPATTTINQLLYSSAANTVVGLATANSAALVTTSAGVPVLSSSMTNGQLIIGSTGATPVAASLTQGTNMTITAGAGTLSLASKGGLLGIQIFTSGTAQTYTPTSGTNNIIIELIGGGGGGGGCAATSAQTAGGGSGGGGAYVRKLVTGMSALTGTYTVAASANGGSAGANAGTAGNNTTFQINSVTYTAGGGGAGAAGTAAAGVGALSAGGVGGTGTNGDINISGSTGGQSVAITAATLVVVNGGGGSGLGFGQPNPPLYAVNSSSAGANGNNYGGGGSGGKSAGTQSSAAGGNGAAGLIIVWEFS